MVSCYDIVNELNGSQINWLVAFKDSHVVFGRKNEPLCYNLCDYLNLLITRLPKFI